MMFVDEFTRGNIFFFQAEDGIRYLVRSRGLGDVYKRQLLLGSLPGIWVGSHISAKVPDKILRPILASMLVPVSYTHLTLPTSDLV